MAKKNRTIPDYVFETSWEVCNKVGGIYTVLSTRAKTLQDTLQDKIIFIGPDFGAENENPDFLENPDLLSEWRIYASESESLKIRIGRWDIPGKPIAVLVDYKSYFSVKDEFFFRMWEKFHVESIHANGDYDESCMFAYAAGLVIESFYKYYRLENNQVVAHFNEWMLGMGLLYIKDKVPAIATIFTTHATSIGRSIAGNNKPLYACFDHYNGDQMARELGMEAKHSVEKRAAWNADCFTTVSDITACECAQLLDKVPDVVTPNGFEDNFVPQGKAFERKRKIARKSLLQVVGQLTGEKIREDALMLAISGRYEYKNKGIDLFIEAMNRIRTSVDISQDSRPILAFILVPAWQKGPRTDLQLRLQSKKIENPSLLRPYLTHELVEPQSDKVCGYLNHLNFNNQNTDRVKLIFVPSYLTGEDGIFNLSYYDVLIGMDLTVFPSYYEPWGYTPLESIAFSVPTITTNLAGFGLWAMEEGAVNDWTNGVEVLSRTDDNYFEVAERIKDVILDYAGMNPEETDKIRSAARKLSGKADWSHFIARYHEAYELALKNAKLRNRKKLK